MAPNTFDEWLEVSKERQSDAAALLKSRRDSIGSVYMVGYAIETNLKAIIAKNKEKVPKIHGIRDLWLKAGFKLSDINDKSGEKIFFFEEWTTDLRYEVTLDQTHNPISLLKAAGNLLSWIQRNNLKNKSKRGKP